MKKGVYSFILKADLLAMKETAKLNLRLVTL